jgi:hypothetical protein
MGMPLPVVGLEFLFLIRLLNKNKNKIITIKKYIFFILVKIFIVYWKIKLLILL